MPWRPSVRGARWRRFRTTGLIASLLALIVLVAVMASWLVPAVGDLWRADGDRSGGGEPEEQELGVQTESLGALRTGTEDATQSDRATPVRVRFRRPPRGGLLFNLDTGRVLWRHRAKRKLPIASLTKLATAIVTAERTSPGERALITRRALNVSGSGVGRLPRGKRVGVHALLHGLLLVSGNDAALALALHVGGSKKGFVRLMNSRARRLGLTCTRFVSPHGLEYRNRSCAADLAVLAQVAMKKRRIARTARKKKVRLRFPIKGRRLELASTNPLLRTGYRGTIGLKTGYNAKAGHCLVGIARRGKRRLGVVLLHSPDPNRQARKLLNAGFRRT